MTQLMTNCSRSSSPAVSYFKRSDSDVQAGGDKQAFLSGRLHSFRCQAIRPVGAAAVEGVQNHADFETVCLGGERIGRPIKRLVTSGLHTGMETLIRTQRKSSLFRPAPRMASCGFPDVIIISDQGDNEGYSVNPEAYVALENRLEGRRYFNGYVRVHCLGFRDCLNAIIYCIQYIEIGQQHVGDDDGGENGGKDQYIEPEPGPEVGPVAFPAIITK
ncbi:hypothetical protein OH491_28015 (plasmid) [Termitidicoccus mucosus]|uniref:hypothetical protein n=1 Tax=Termitidicoccus mucosus TaxID=1184151 RepID=UPI003182E50E